MMNEVKQSLTSFKNAALAPFKHNQLFDEIEHFHYSLSASDLSLKRGIDIGTAEQLLIEFCLSCNGVLEHRIPNQNDPKTTEVVFTFPRDFRSQYRFKLINYNLLQSFSKVWNGLLFVFRIVFGVFLGISILCLFAAIMIITVAIMHSQGNRGGSNGSPHVPFNQFRNHHQGFPVYRWNDFFWLLLWNSQYNHHRSYRHAHVYPNNNNNNNNNNTVRHNMTRGNDPNPHHHNTQTDVESGENRNSVMNFLESVFSFIFGDGNPNKEINQRRMLILAQAIRHNDGKVIGEQIQPYVDTELLEHGSSKNKKHEGYVLPILKHFGGKAESTDDGILVYFFPLLTKLSQVKSTTYTRPALECPSVTEFHEEVPELEELEEELLTSNCIPPVPVYEQHWVFSHAEPSQIKYCILFGLLNLVECIILGGFLFGLIKVNSVDVSNLGNFVLLMKSFYSYFLVYAILYFLVPGLRYLWIRYLNNQIDKRNMQRKEAAMFLVHQLQQQAPKFHKAKHYHFAAQ